MTAKFKYLLLWPAYESAAALQFLVGTLSERRSGEWSKRLNYTYFIRGALGLTIAAVCVILVVCRWKLTRTLEQSYVVQAVEAFKATNYDEAALCAHRLLGFHPDDRQYRYMLAQAYEGQGDLAHATALMRSLAPTTEPGFGPAQIWLVRQALERGTPLTDEEARGVESTLIRLRNDGVVGGEANTILAGLYLRTGRVRFVLQERSLTEAAERVPELRLRLYQARIGDVSPDVLRLAARQLVDHFQGVLKKRPEDAATRRLYAESLVLLGDFQSADVTLREGLTITPDDRRLGEALAATMLTQAKQAIRSGQSADFRRELCRAAIDALRQYAPDDDARTLELARLYASADEPEESEVLYRAIVARSPLVRMELADMLRAAGRSNEAAAEYAAVVQAYAAAPAADQANPDVRIGAAFAALQSGQFEPAVRWLTSPSISDPRARKMLLEAYVDWSDSLPASNMEERVRLLEEALKRESFYPPAVQRMLSLSEGDTPSAVKTRQLLGDMIARGDAPATAYSLLGTHALVKGDPETAIKYLEQAQRLDPDLIATLNNLAWALAFGKNPDLERALALCNSAVAKAPRDLHVRDTRGQILAKLRRWQEAIVDLEMCAKKMDGQARFETAIADVYEHLGLDDLAEQHRAKAPNGPP